MAVLNKFNAFAQDLGTAVHNFSTHTLKVAFSNTAPVATNAVLTDITQIAAGGGYVAGGFALTGVTLTSASGLSKLTITDYGFTATGIVADFRYVVLYNDTAGTKPLIGWYDYGTVLSMVNTDTLTIDFDATNGVLVIG